MKNRNRFFAATLFGFLAVNVHAQFVPDDGSNGGVLSDSDPFGGGNNFSNVTTTFDGISVNVRRLIRDPGADGTVRLVMTAANASDKDRRLLILSPKTSLIDELGNVYYATRTVGIEICEYKGKWSDDVSWCGRDRRNVTTRLAPGVPVMVAIQFKPAEHFVAELAKMSQTVSLRMRIGHWDNQFKQGHSADIVVNNIPFPR